MLAREKRDPRDERIEELEEQLRALRKALVPRLLFPLEWKLNRGETSVLACLYSSPDGFRSREMLRTYAEIFWSKNAMSETLQVRVFHLRRKLRPFGIKIYTRYTEGFYLSSDDKRIIKIALDKENGNVP